MSTIKVGLVGAGYISDWHADTLRAIDGVEVVAVCDTARGNAERLAARHGAQVFTSLGALIDAGIADAVHILTPPQFHRDLAVEALKGGLHCLVEKPVALSVDETRDIVAAADAAGKQFGAGHNFMGLPAYQRLKHARDSGVLGRISSAEINWHFPLTPLRSGPYGLWLLREPQNLLLELGPHLFGFAVDLFGTPEIEHLSLGKPVNFPDGTMRPQSLRIVARAGDVDLNINISLVETTDDRSVILRGSGAIARLDYAADVLIIDRENASDIVVNPLKRQMALAGRNMREGVVNATRQVTSLYQKSPYGISFMGMFDAFYDAINKGRPLDARFDGNAAIKVMQGVEDSIALMPPNPAPVHTKKRAPKPDILVIGGTGFIGRRLTEVLVERGHDVRVLSRGSSNPFGYLPENVEIFSASLKDSDGLDRAMDGIKAVYHLGKSHEDTWEACIENDVNVTVGIAKAALAAGVERFIYTGTIASYDMSDPTRTITENTGFDGDMSDRNLYARSKAMCETRLVEMQKNEGLNLTIARPGIVVGAGGPLQHWGIGRWHGAGAVRIWGAGDHRLPFVLIDDVAEALVRIIEVEEAIGTSLNLIGEPMLSARGYFDAIHEELGARITVKPGFLPMFFATDAMKYMLKKYGLRRKGVIRASLSDWKSRAHYSPFDNSHAKAVLDWSPEPDRRNFIQRAIVQANLFGF